jgi:hypothetical protein
MSTLRQIVSQNPAIFGGGIENPAAVARLEEELGVCLQEPVRWFLLEAGSGPQAHFPVLAHAWRIPCGIGWRLRCLINSL